MRHSALLVFNIALCSSAHGLEVFKDFRISNQFTQEISGYAYPFKNRNTISTAVWSKKNVLETWNEPRSPDYEDTCSSPIFLGNDRAVNRIISVREIARDKIVILTQMRSVVSKTPYAANLYLLFNPRYCNGATLQVPGEKGQLRYHQMPVPYSSKTFDIFPIFYNGSTQKHLLTIQRHDVNKVRGIKVPDSIDPEVKLSGDRDLIYAVNSKASTKGYFIVANDQEAATLYLLSPKLTLEKKIHKEGIYAYAASAEFGWITICYNEKNRLMCDVLEKDLSLKFQVPMTSRPNGTLFNAWVDNLFDGTVMVLSSYNFTVKNDTDNERVEVTYVQRIFKDRSTSEPLEIGRVVGAESRPRGLLMDNGEYCAVNVVAKQVDQDWSSNVTAICAEPLVKPDIIPEEESVDEEEDSEEDSEEDEE